jgi:hypothetical protein
MEKVQEEGEKAYLKEEKDLFQGRKKNVSSVLYFILFVLRQVLIV